MSDLDLNFLPIYRLGGQILPTMPGLQVFAPPRRTSRGRERDNLVVFLTLTGNVPLTTSEYGAIIRKISEQFYRTSGSLTYALKNAAETANFALLERNLRTTGQGQYVIGLLVLGALRGDQFYTVQSGPTHVFWIGQQGSRHLHDTQLSGRGLGLSQTTSLYYSQVNLQPGDRLVFSALLPEGWEGFLSGDMQGSTLESIRRNLVGLTNADLNAVVVHVSTGKGELSLLRPARQDAPPISSIPAEQPVIAARMAGDEEEPDFDSDRHAASRQPDLVQRPIEPSETGEPSILQEALSELAEEIEAQDQVVPAPMDSSIEAQLTPDQFLDSQPPTDVLEERPEVLSSFSIERQVTGRQPRRAPKASRQAARTLVSGLNIFRQIGGGISAGFRSLLPRLLPGMDSTRPATLSGSVMAFIAVAVPLLVVTIATVFYFQYGRANQYQEYFDNASQVSRQAAELTDPDQIREAWQTTLLWLDRAEAYQETPDSRALRTRAQDILDNMDSILRLDFQPAINGGLPKGVQVSRMVALDSDVYILNGANGDVIRASLAGRGYNLDSEFRCGPGSYEGFFIGQLVDIIALPKGNARNAAIMGIDAGGNLIYCAPKRVPQVAMLAPPDTNWNRVTGFDLDGSVLYVLDAPARAVWVYAGDGINFKTLPIFFFGQQIPAVNTAVDLIVNGDQLFMLHSDGHLSTCTYSRLEGVPTRCTDPAELIDNRPGKESGSLSSETAFNQILFSPPPDSSIFLLEPQNQAIYRFSPRSLELLNQLRTYPGKENPFPAGRASAMTVSQTHVVFIAIDNQVFFAVDVP